MIWLIREKNDMTIVDGLLDLCVAIHPHESFSLKSNFITCLIVAKR
jgi:hypothetical protein